MVSAAALEVDFAGTHDPEVALVDGIAGAGQDGCGGGVKIGAAVLGLADGEISGGVTCGVGGEVDGGAGDGFGFAVCVVVEVELDVDARAYGLAVVVDCGDAEAGAFAGAHGVGDGFDVDAEAAVGGEEAAAAGDLAVGWIGDAGLDGVVEVGVRSALGVSACRDVDFEDAVAVELAGLFGLLIAGETGAVVGAFVRVVFGARGIVRFLFATPIVALVIDAVLDPCIGHGLAEEVAGIDGDGHGRALEDALPSGGDGYAVFGLAVLLDVEAAGDGVGGIADAERVVAERGVFGQIEVAGDVPGRGDGHPAREDGLFGFVDDGDGDRSGLRESEGVAVVLAQDGLPVHGVEGSIDGALGEDVARVLASGGGRERPGSGGGGGELIAFAGDDPEVVLSVCGRGHGEGGEAGGIGGGCRRRVLAEAGVYFCSGDGLSGEAVDDVGDDSAGAGSRDKRHLGDHEERVGLVVAVGGLEEVEAGVEPGDGEVVAVGDVGGGDLLAPAGDELGLVEEGNLGELGLADDGGCDAGWSFGGSGGAGGRRSRTGSGRSGGCSPTDRSSNRGTFRARSARRCARGRAGRLRGRRSGARGGFREI